MANQTQNTKQEKKGSMAPIIIIAVIFVATIGGVYVITQSGGQSDDNSSNVTATNGNGGAKEVQPLPNYGTAPPGAPAPHFKGSDSAPVVVEEFADFQCPTCALVYPRMNEVNSKFGSKIKFIYRNYPLTNLHRNSYDAAVAAEAAGMQGKFWEMQNLLFSNQAQWSNTSEARRMFEGYADKIGLDVEKYKNDVLGFAAKGRVDEDMRRARALNLTGTPTILVNGRPVNSFEVAEISRVIQSEIDRFTPKEEKADEKPADNTEAAPAEAPEKK
jgi:protein-disulfide isomerase